MLVVPAPPQAHTLAVGCGGVLPRRAHGDEFGADSAAQHGIRAQVFLAVHGGGHAARPTAAIVQGHGLGTQAEPVRLRATHGDIGARDAALFQAHQVHGGRADEARGKGGSGRGVHIARRRALLHTPLVQQHHLVSHAHGLGLVVRHVHHGEAQALLQLAQLGAHLLAQLRIQVGQRLVHQAHAGLGHQGAAQRHALLLPAGQLCGPTLQQRGQAEQLGGLRHALRGLGLGHLAHRQAKADVLRHAQVRKQRIVLKHHRDATPRRRQLRDVLPVDAHAARRG